MIFLIQIKEPPTAAARQGRMWSYHPELLETPVPRYTSYPTAAEFHEGQGAADMGGALDAIEAGTPVSLYLHIPFCEQICWYCGCNTAAANRASRLAHYLDALDAEMALVSERLGRRARIVRIAFGGGSPNVLVPAQFLALVERLRALFGCTDAPLSIELDPRGFSHEWAGTLGALGASRVSLGVQTFAPHVQQAIGRIQPAEMIARAMAWLRAAGVESINFDLMYGLPGQSLIDLAETLETAARMGPDRVALFGYAHVPHLIPRQRRIDERGLGNARLRFDQAAFGYRTLVDQGYAAIGFDHFALPGDALAMAARRGRLSRNFQGFTEDDTEVLIGLGASAISSFPDRILQNEKNSGRYRMKLGAARFAQSRGVRRTADDRMRGAIIEALLCRGVVDTAALGDCGEIRARLQPFVDRGLMQWDGDLLRLSPGALPYARVIASAFDRYRHPDSRRFSNAI